MGCLTYSRQLCLSREYLYIWWPRSAIGTGLGNSVPDGWARCFGLPATTLTRYSAGPLQHLAIRSRRLQVDASADFAPPGFGPARSPREMSGSRIPARPRRCSRTELADECSATPPRTRRGNLRAGRNVRV